MNASVRGEHEWTIAVAYSLQEIFFFFTGLTYFDREALV